MLRALVLLAGAGACLAGARWEVRRVCWVLLRSLHHPAAPAACHPTACQPGALLLLAVLVVGGRGLLPWRARQPVVWAPLAQALRRPAC